MPLTVRSLARAALAACALAALAAPLRAQSAAPDLRAEAVAGSEAERYLRVLQVAGEAPLYPWSARAFSPDEVDALVPDSADHPWAARLPPADSADQGVRVPRPRLDLTFNSAFPQGGNDGPVWAGRGLTASASAGVEYRRGILSVRVEPVVVWTQNQSFDLVPNGRPDSLRYLNAQTPIYVDVPQRFGDGSFASIHPGQSTVRLDGRGIAFGASTANEQWGPAADQPLVLGTNAPGVPRAFLGTSHPWKVGIGRVHGRVFWGDLRQSSYSPMPDGHATRRFASGIVAVFLPYGLDGLEVGYLRFWHEAWPVAGFKPRMLQRPFEAFFRSSLNHPDEGRLNQIAAGFLRWTLPRGGVEVYGEFAREDHNFDLLDFLMEPDRSSSYLVGGRKVWRAGGALMSFRAEWVDAQPSHLNQASHQGNLYRHIELQQGHTFRGQLLGSWAGYGGGGSVVALDGYTRAGRWSVDWTRTRIGSPQDEGDGVDVMHSLGAEALLFQGGWDLLARLRGTMELNRGFADDAFNLTAGLGVRLGL